MLEPSFKLSPADWASYRTACLVGGVGFLVSLFMLMNTFSIANSFLSTEIEMLVLSPLGAVLVGASVFVMSAAWMGQAYWRRWVSLAAWSPSLFVMFLTGLHTSILMHGVNGPWGRYLEDLDPATSQGLIGAGVWPLTFALSAGLAGLVCYLLFVGYRTLLAARQETASMDDDPAFEEVDLSDLGVVGRD